LIHISSPLWEKFPLKNIRLWRTTLRYGPNKKD